MRIIDIRIGQYFSGMVLFFGGVLAFAGLMIIFNYPITGLVLILAGVVIFTTHNRLQVDLDKKTYHDYVWILGLKNGDKGTFDRIEYLFIKRSKVSQTMNSLVSSATIHKYVFDAYLKFSEKKKIYLMTKESKETLTRKLKPIAAALNVDIVDYSD